MDVFKFFARKLAEDASTTSTPCIPLRCLGLPCLGVIQFVGTEELPAGLSLMVLKGLSVPKLRCQRCGCLHYLFAPSSEAVIPSVVLSEVGLRLNFAMQNPSEPESSK